MRLILGVLDVGYSDASNGGKLTTTGDVAEILERNYGVMATFFESRKDKIADWLAESVANAIQDIANGARVTNVTFAAEQKIEAEFRAFIYANEMQNALTAAGGGVLSKAAQAGVSQRRKRPYAKRAPRPAFVDSGLYVQSFRAWIEANAVSR